MLLFTDLGRAVRLFRTRPAFAACAVLTLAVGIGANAAVFTFVDQALFKPLPYEDAEQLYKLNPVDPQTGERFGMVSGLVVEALAQNSRQLVGLATSDEADVMPAPEPGALEARPFLAAEVSRNFLEVLGVHLLMGHGFAGDPTCQAASEILISYEWWQKRFGGRDDIIGQTIPLGTSDAVEVPHVIVGVLPKDYYHPVSRHAAVDVLKAKPVEPGLESAPLDAVEPLIRLKAGVTRVQGEAEINALAAAASPQSERIRYALTPIHTALFDDLRPRLLIFPLVAGLVLLISCANAAHLLLARGLERTRELAIRQALGASRWRLASTLLSEGLWLSATAGVLALVVTINTYDAITSVVPERAFAFRPTGPDLRLFLFTATLSVGSALLFSLLPAVRHSRPSLTNALRSGLAGHLTRTHARSAALLVTTQVALGLTALAGAGLLLTSYWRLTTIPLGFDLEGVLVIRAEPHQTRVPVGPLRRQFAETMLDRLQGVPGVQAVAGASVLPIFARARGWTSVQMPGTRPPHLPQVFFVTPRYFEVMGLPVVRGRAFSGREARGDAPATMVDERTARMLFKGGDPLGRTVTNDGETSARPVVGVVANARRSYRVQEPIVYQPFPPDWASDMDLVVRIDRDRPEIRGALAAALRQLDPHLMMSIRSLDELLAQMELREPRFAALMLTLCGLVGLLLLAIGIFGVVSHAVTQRVHEIGVRMALGADARGVRWLVVRSAFAPVGLGLVGGLLGASLVARLLEAQIADVAPADLRALPVTGTVVLLAALFASYVPARRASCVDPIQVLRQD
ncbi:MAG: FtsX-like permease family protein [Luteitalea sp.]|nr:FtsX-like permease family protein [Luteitalea sp.]